jgi:hypothetical protein
MAGFGLSGLLNGMAGSALTAKLRADGMTALMRQEIGFFDVEENSAPNLTTFLSEKVEKVQTLTTEQLDLIAQILGGVGSSMVIIFWLCSWKLALVWGAVLPVFGIIASLEISFMSGGADADAAKKGKDPSKRSTCEKTANHIVGEAVFLSCILSHARTHSMLPILPYCHLLLFWRIRSRSLSTPVFPSSALCPFRSPLLALATCTQSACTHSRERDCRWWAYALWHLTTLNSSFMMPTARARARWPGT